MHYYDTHVSIPDKKGKITIKMNKYVMYEVGRKYIKEKKYNNPIRITIGIKDDDGLMIPNENYLKYFPEDELPIEIEVNRSSCLRIGAYSVINKIIKDYELDKLCTSIFNNDDGKLILDLAAYSIIEESNVAQYYPDYAYNHPLFTNNMKIYSDSKVSDLFKDMSDDQRITFINAWTNMRKSNGVYISYDSTNKNCQAGEVDLAEFGHAKDDETKPIINIAIAYDSKNKDPLFYEEYPGSIVDISQLDFMIKKVESLGLKDIGFIIDRGYFSKGNLRYLDDLGFNFLIAAKGNRKFINKFVKEVKGSFENKRINRISKFSCVGTTIEKSLFNDDSPRYIHIFYNELKAAIDRENIEAKIDKYSRILANGLGSKKDYKSFESYFYLDYDKSGNLISYSPRNKTIENEKEYCGYFVLVSSKKMKAQDALLLYKSRDESEKLFRSDKSFLGGSSFRVQSDESIKSKTLVSFIALIIRNRIYRYLLEEMDSSNNKYNYMTVPGAIKELEKIEMIKGVDGVYRLDHAVTATQKKILKAFNMDARNILDKAETIKNQLIKADK